MPKPKTIAGITFIVLLGLLVAAYFTQGATRNTLIFIAIILGALSRYLVAKSKS